MKFTKVLNYIFLFLFLVVAGLAVSAQAYSKDIAAFKKQDSLQFPAPQSILFIGSSSFTKWKDVQKYFPSYPIINRAFGGSKLPDLIKHADDVIFPYSPKQIIVYCGENDMASSDTMTGQAVLNRFKKLFFLIRKKLPAVSIAFVSMKPSPSRQLIQEKLREGNELIRTFLKTQKATDYIDVYKEMIDDEGKPVPDLFVEDNLHMNKKGYVIWQRVIEPYLKK